LIARSRKPSARDRRHKRHQGTILFGNPPACIQGLKSLFLYSLFSLDVDSKATLTGHLKIMLHTARLGIVY